LTVIITCGLSAASGLIPPVTWTEGELALRRRRRRLPTPHPDVRLLVDVTAGRVVGVVVAAVDPGEELPDEKVIKAFLVSSNIDVKRFWVSTRLVKVATSARKKIALMLT